MGEGRDVLKALIAVCSRSCSVLCNPIGVLEFDVPKVIYTRLRAGQSVPMVMGRGCSWMWDPNKDP